MLIDTKFNALRVQRRRVKGYRMPRGTIYVGRPTKWGNPYVVKKLAPRRYAVFNPEGEQLGAAKINRWSAAEQAVLRYRIMMEKIIKDEPSALDELKDHPLACWCSIGEPCHRDVLIELANYRTAKT